MADISSRLELDVLELYPKYTIGENTHNITNDLCIYISDSTTSITILALSYVLPQTLVNDVSFTIGGDTINGSYSTLGYIESVNYLGALEHDLEVREGTYTINAEEFLKDTKYNCVLNCSLYDSQTEAIGASTPISFSLIFASSRFYYKFVEENESIPEDGILSMTPLVDTLTQEYIFNHKGELQNGKFNGIYVIDAFPGISLALSEFLYTANLEGWITTEWILDSDHPEVVTDMFTSGKLAGNFHYFKFYINSILWYTGSDSPTRLQIIEISKDDNELLEITITLYSEDFGDDPIPTIDGLLLDDTRNWDEGTTVDSVVFNDTNAGSAVDPSYLLFKANYANIYSCIQLKDNTLFLGNYVQSKQINKIFETLDDNEDKISVSAPNSCIYRPIKYDSSSTTYPYVPDMISNSQQKRVFKKGEQYALGMVFIDKYGTLSSVYYCNKFLYSPTVEPFLRNDKIVLLDNTYNHTFAKPVCQITLDKKITNILAANDIVAVIPVYAVKQSNSVMCLGFLSPTISSNLRELNESIDVLYSWFYRNFSQSELSTGRSIHWDIGEDSTAIANYSQLSLKGIEIQNLHTFDTDTGTLENWSIESAICSLNTPEVEVEELLSNSLLLGAKCRNIRTDTSALYTNNIQVQVNNKYVRSRVDLAKCILENTSSIPLNYTDFSTWIENATSSLSPMATFEGRFISGYVWKGFVDQLYLESNRLSQALREQNYTKYMVYPWQRNIIGGELESSSISTKVILNGIYYECINSEVSKLNVDNNTIKNAVIYRDFDTTSILRLEDKVYQGNVDYISTTLPGNEYRAWALTCYTTGDANTGLVTRSYPITYSDIYAGYDEDGKILDPISIKYKTAPHIVLLFTEDPRSDSIVDNTGLQCVELYNDIELKTSPQDLTLYQWIKCGYLKRIVPGLDTKLIYEEGDYFFGRFDSLRTYQYAEGDPNSVTEIVSGMLCSRVNLDSRCDRNRGTSFPLLSPENFNIFNPVYNQLNNYFTFSYIDTTDIMYNRKYKNSILWSMTKEFSSDVDSWCNILDINTLDLDGDKGLINSIERLGNDLIVFLDTGISLILYNEKTQISTEEGVPIEITNSNKVTGKRYLYDNVGCQYKESITKSPNGIYFVDNINKSLYELSADGKLQDLCTAFGMKSWGLANLKTKWWAYYDHNSQEVIFTNNNEALAFSDLYGRFNAFLDYGGIRWNFRAGDSIILVKTTVAHSDLHPDDEVQPAFARITQENDLNPSTEQQSHGELLELESNYSKLINNTFWKKNSIDATKFFGEPSYIEVQLQCNPEPTLDKSFSTVEYRMDCFGDNNLYLPNVTFSSFRAWNEYLNTGEVSLLYSDSEGINPVLNTDYSARLRKKFRIWRLDIPRAEDSINRKRDRIRNPWCNIWFKMNTDVTSRIVLNDLSILYFK